MSITPQWTCAYPTREEATNAQDALRQFDIGTRLAHSEEYDIEPEVWWEVTIVELPARRIHEALLVDRGPRTTSPSRTEVDEHDRGASTMWDLERESDRRYEQ